MSLPVDLRNMFAFCREVSIANTRYAETDLSLPLVNLKPTPVKLRYPIVVQVFSIPYLVICALSML
jgi:hypothetical protein